MSSMVSSIIEEIIVSMNEVESLKVQLIEGDGRTTRTFNLVQDYHGANKKLNQLLARHGLNDIHKGEILERSAELGYPPPKVLTKLERVKLRRALQITHPIFKTLRT